MPTGYTLSGIGQRGAGPREDIRNRRVDVLGVKIVGAQTSVDALGEAVGRVMTHRRDRIPGSAKNFAQADEHPDCAAPSDRLRPQGRVASAGRGRLGPETSCAPANPSLSTSGYQKWALELFTTGYGVNIQVVRNGINAPWNRLDDSEYGARGYPCNDPSKNSGYQSWWVDNAY
ncbi:hypothetical protein ACFV98_30720 [Streptomyces violascens]|uniref:hypothetical protein n=1 Tax=Streptomyces violascens TaxID=67381 RepID=UPI00364BEBB2